MASLNDTINAITGRLLSNPLGPAVEASERERGNRDKLAAEDRVTRRMTDLEERRAKLEEQKATSLLKLRNEFDEKQGKLNREGRLKEIEAQASAYVNRLTEADKRKEVARLRALVGDLSGKDIDEQIADGLKKQSTGDYAKVRGAVGEHRDYEARIKGLDSKIAGAEKADQDYISKTSKSLAEDAARKVVDGTLQDDERKALKGSLSAESIRNAKGIKTERRNELLAMLETETRSNQIKNEVFLTSSTLDRTTGDALKALRTEKIKAESEFSQFRNSDSGKLAMDRILFERGSAPVGPLAPAAPAKIAAGVDAFDAVRNQIAGAANGGDGSAPDQFRAAMGERQAMDEPLNQFQQPEINQPSLEQPLRAMLAAAKSRNASWEQRSAAGEARARRDQFLAQRMGLQPEQIGSSVFNRSPESQMKTMIENRDPRAMGFIDSMGTPDRDELYSLMMGNALNPSRAGNPAIDAKAAAIWGPGAVPLLKEAEQLATSRGMDPGEQQAVFNAAIGGDTNAQGKVKLMLDYVRQAKQADQTGAFQPLMPVRDQYPGITNTAPVYQTPQFQPVMPLREYPGTINTAPTYQGPQFMPAR